MRTAIRDVERLTCQQPWLLATLTVRTVVTAPPSAKPEEASAATTVLRHRVQDLGRLVKLRAQLQANARSGTDASSVVADYLATVGVLSQVELETLPASIVARSLVQQTVADTGRVYFLNSNLPWFGDAKLLSELSGGILTKVEAAVTSNLKDGADSIVALLAATKSTEDASGADESEDKVRVQTEPQHKPAGGDAAGVPPPKPILIASLEVQEQSFVYTFEAVVGSAAMLKDKGCDDLRTLKSETAFTRALVGGPAPPPAPTPAPENSITVKGTIQLPRPPEK